MSVTPCLEQGRRPLTMPPVNPGRQPNSLEFLGHGLFVSNGEEWQKPRNLIKPAFKRTLITDRKMVELHVERFLKQLPQDGRTLDLAPLFWLLSADLGSHFMFGESFDSLLPGQSAAVDGRIGGPTAFPEEEAPHQTCEEQPPGKEACFGVAISNDTRRTDVRFPKNRHAPNSPNSRSKGRPSNTVAHAMDLPSDGA